MFFSVVFLLIELCFYAAHFRWRFGFRIDEWNGGIRAIQNPIRHDRLRRERRIMQAILLIQRIANVVRTMRLAAVVTERIATSMLLLSKQGKSTLSRNRVILHIKFNWCELKNLLIFDIFFLANHPQISSVWSYCLVFEFLFTIATYM